MKPSIPEIGTVIRLQEDSAIILLKGGESCKGCGQAKIGLCRAGGTSMVLTAKNQIGAKIGDIVTIGLDRSVKVRGYLLAFVIPIISLILGSLIGYIVGGYFEAPFLDFSVGFSALIISYYFSLKMLKRLDSSSIITVKSVIRH